MKSSLGKIYLRASVSWSAKRSTELRGIDGEALCKHTEHTREAAGAHDTNGDRLHHLQHLESKKWASSRVACVGQGFSEETKPTGASGCSHRKKNIRLHPVDSVLEDVSLSNLVRLETDPHLNL